MVRKFENSNKIIIQNFPFGQWLIGIGLTLLIGVFVISLIFTILFSPNSLFTERKLTWFELVPIISFGLAISLIVIFEINFISLICTPLTVIKIDFEAKSIDIVCNRFYGKEINRYYFSQISKFKSYKELQFFSKKHLLTLVLSNQQENKLKIPTGDLKNTVKLVKEINKAIKKTQYESFS